MDQDNIEDLYALSPMQRGMLFHAINHPGSEAYFEQFSGTLQGCVDFEAFRQAWHTTIVHHPALRSSFFWEGLEQPVQVVHKDFDLDFTLLDWRSEALDASEITTRIEQVAEEDRRRGFDLSDAPLMRFHIIRLAEDRAHFLWSFSHMLLDGWCLGLVFRDCISAYQAIHAGHGPVLTVTRPYGQFIEWLEEQNVESGREAWAAYLDGLEAPTPLPFIPTRSKAEGREFGEQPLSIRPEVSAALNARAQKEGVTLNTLMRLAWSKVLGQTTGSDDVVFGATVSGRPAELEGSEQMVGLFINTVPCRVSLRPAADISQTLQSLHKDQNELSAYEHLSLADMRQGLPFGGETPLFESILVFENYPASPSDVAGSALGFTLEDFAARERTNFPLTIVVVPGERILVRFLYDQAAYTAETIVRMSVLLSDTLNKLLDTDRNQLASLYELPEAEFARVQQLGANRLSASPLSFTSIVDRIAERSVEQPNKVVLEDPESAIDAQTLESTSNWLAAELAKMGVTAGARVAVCIARSVDTVIANLAVLKTGAAYVPIDPDYPAGRIEHILTDSEAQVWITVAGQEPEGVTFSGQTYHLDRSAAPANYPAAPVAIYPDSPAYCIYTSGSTGVPKGVVVSHKNIAEFAHTQSLHYKVSTGDRMLHGASVGFDAATWETWPWLCAGATVVSISKETLTDWERLPEHLAGLRISHAFLTTALAERVIDLPWPEPAPKVLMTGGERLSRFPARALPFKFFNNYGPTESTVLVTSGEVVPTPSSPVTPSIGPVFGANRLWILNPALEPVPVGAPGELYVAGPQLTPGYLNLPGLTAENFLPEPRAGQAGAVMYKTGDRVTLLPDDELRFEGRVDDQIKLLGNRIEIGEIEHQIRASGLCREFHVALETRADGSGYLAAYIVTEAPERKASDVERALRRQLPDAMIPSFWLELKALPLTANGKLDKAALRASVAGAEAGPDAGDSPVGNPVYDAVIEAYRDILDQPEAHADDSFFQLGGHSLIAMRLISRIRETLNAELPLQALFETPKARDLAALIEAEYLGQGSQRPAIQSSEPRERYPLSFSQERLWVLSQIQTQIDPYLVTLALKLEGPIVRRPLQQSIQALISRHASLRTAFRADEGQPPYQTVLAEPNLLVEFKDWSHKTAVEQSARLEGLVQREAERPFFLDQGSPLRATLIRMREDEHALVLTVHHIAIDGWSLGVLAQDWYACYEACVNDTEPQLAPLPIQYHDYAVWQRNWMQGDVLRAQTDFWRNQLGGVPHLELATDRARPARMSYRGAAVPFTVDAETTAKIRELAADENATLSMVLMTAYASLLSTYSQQDDFAIGMPIANREGSETERLIGFFVNTLAVRCQFEPEAMFADVLRQIRKNALEAYMHRDLPFEKLVEELKPERDLSRSPIFQVMFTFQNTPEIQMDTGALRISSYPIDAGTAKFDLTLTMLEQGDTLEGSLEYATDLFDEVTVQRFVAQFRYLLSIAAELDDVALKAVPLLTQDDHALLEGFNQTEIAYPEISTLGRFLEIQAAETPTAPAVVCGDSSLDYQEFQTQVQAWALRLQAEGVGPESRVAVYLDRSIEMVVALHAVVTAGGAYVPIDPSYPAERVAYLIEDSAPALILSSEARIQDLVDAQAPVVAMDVAELLDSATADIVTPKQPSADSLAYLIYTSGSTGKPKGAMVSHAAIINRLQWMREAFNIGPGDRILQKTPYSFDVSVWEFFWPFMTGATLVVAEPEKHKDPAYIAEIIDRERITVLHFVPSMLRAFLEHESASPLRSMRMVICSGEALTQDLLDRFAMRYPQATLENLYGPTEAAVDVSHWSATHGRADHHVPIGKPIANTALHILDPQLNPCPPGVPGELHIGGIQLARGYLNRAALTAERFIPDPFSARAGARLYKTGDKARYLSDGNIEYLGRLDFQVKIRGFRIELGEIEEALKYIPGVSDSVALARQDDSGFEILVAYVIPENGTTLKASVLRKPLSQTLPDYMVPTHFVFLEAFPVSPNGKLDRPALPEPSVQPEELENDTPMSPIESVVASIWNDVLKRTDIGAQANFFELGGHSLLATQILSRIREVFRMEVSMLTLFESPRLRDFTQRVVHQAEDSALIEKIAQAWLKLQAMTPEEKEALRRRKAAARS